MTQRGHGGVRRTAIAEYPAPSIVHRADRRWGRLALPRLLLISRLLQKIRQSGEDDDDKFSLPTSSGLSENVFEGGARVVNCRRKRRVAHPPELRPERDSFRAIIIPLQAVYCDQNRNSKSALQTQERLCVAVRDPFPITLADRKLLQECTRLSHRSVRVINREHDSRNADLEQQIEERRCKIEAAEGVVHVLTQIGTKGTRELRHLSRHVLVESRQHKRNAFAQVANDDLQFRIAIEHASQNHANEMDTGFDVPAPACARKHRGHGWRKPTERSLDDRLGRHRW